MTLPGMGNKRQQQNSKSQSEFSPAFVVGNGRRSGGERDQK